MATPVRAASLTVEDFSFDGELGCTGASIEQLGENHFRITPGHAPEHPGWANMVQFTILRHAKGNALRLEVVYEPATEYLFNDYSYSWSYDGEEWHPIHWEIGRKEKTKKDTLIFPTFTQDRIYVGHQVPISYAKLKKMVKAWGKNPYVEVDVLGKSLEGRDIWRLTVTDPDSPVPAVQRWVHYFANQHPGEHNAQWRMAGMMDWLLSDAGADCRKASICHFIFITSPDAPSHGWYRVNAQGVDMNRSYRADSADKLKQAHEAYVVQNDLEKLMAAESPVTDIWAMHTWGGKVEPLLYPGPEMTESHPWTDLRDIVERNDEHDFIIPIVAEKDKEEDDLTYWTHGPHKQFGVTAVLCEGAGDLCTKEENIESGEVLMKSIAEYYK